jgi:hypothetical protein
LKNTRIFLLKNPPIMYCSLLGNVLLLFKCYTYRFSARQLTASKLAIYCTTIIEYNTYWFSARQRTSSFATYCTAMFECNYGFPLTIYCYHCLNVIPPGFPLPTYCFFTGHVLQYYHCLNIKTTGLPLAGNIVMLIAQSVLECCTY